MPFHDLQIAATFDEVAGFPGNDGADARPWRWRDNRYFFHCERCAAAAFAVSAIRSLFSISPFDPAVLTLVAVFVLMLALAAAFLPARRAPSTDRRKALRTD